MIEAISLPPEVAVADSPIRDLTFERAPDGMRSTGVLGFTSIRAGDLIVELVIRETRDGRPFVAFPHRHSRSGQRFEVARPATHEGRRAIEREVIGELRRRGDLS